MTLQLPRWFLSFLLITIVNLCIQQQHHCLVSSLAVTSKSQGGGKKRGSNQSNKNAKGFGTKGSSTLSWQEVAAKCKMRHDDRLLLPVAPVADSSILPCPCGAASKKSYLNCCAPYHRGEMDPESPLIVLQTRSTAFIRRDIQYIIETTHPTNADWRQDKVAWVRDLNRNMFDNHDFVSLNVIDVEDDDDDDDWTNKTEAYMTFTVLLRKHTKGAADDDDDDDVDALHGTTGEMVIRERSQFLKQDDGRWLYGTGEVSIVQQ